MKKLLVIILSILAAGQLLAQDLTLDEIISKNLTAIGQDKLMKMETIKMTGKMNQEGMEFQIISYGKAPDMARQELEIQGMTIIIVVEGETGWTINPMTGAFDPQDLPAEMINSLIEESLEDPAVNWDNPFYNWKENGIKVVLVGKEDMDGKPVYNLKFTFKNKHIVNYLIDAERFVVLNQISTKSQMGQTYDQEVRYSDYRDIDGILCPFKMEILINGQVTTVLTMDNCEFDIPIDDSIFKKPVQKEN